MIVAPSINSSFLIYDDHQMMVKVVGTREIVHVKELAIKWFNNNANYDDDLLLIFS